MGDLPGRKSKSADPTPEELAGIGLMLVGGIPLILMFLFEPTVTLCTVWVVVACAIFGTAGGGASLIMPIAVGVPVLYAMYMNCEVFFGGFLAGIVCVFGCVIYFGLHHKDRS